MIIHVQDLKGPKEFFETKQDYTVSYLNEPLTAKNVHVKAYAMREGEKIHVELEVDGTITLECSRCLEPFSYAFSEKSRKLYVKPHGNIPADGAEILTFQNLEIDLTPAILEIIQMAIPMKPLCNHNCLGLCPHCGANRNLEKCSCNKNEEEES